MPSGTIAVTTDHSVVYLMGKLTQAEGRLRRQRGGRRGRRGQVVKLFETISREEAVRLSGNGSKSSQSGSSADAQAPIESSAGAQGDGNASGGGSSGVQAIPIK